MKKWLIGLFVLSLLLLTYLMFFQLSKEKETTTVKKLHQKEEQVSEQTTIEVYELKEGLVTQDKLKETTFSNDLVVDGTHHKLQHPVMIKKKEWYFSLVDLTVIPSLQVTKNEKMVTIKYGNKELRYEENESQNQEKIQDYYLSKETTERYLGLQVDYLYNEQSNTIRIQTPEEQQKETFEQGIGSTIFVHKEKIPLEKYEPRNGLYLGAYVLQDEFIDASMEKFNDIMGKKHASFFKYVGYGKPFPTEWVEEVKKAGGFPHIAWEPNDGLGIVKDNTYLRTFAKEAKKAGVPILLRYASEMNGTWTFYSGNEDLYIQKWKIVHDVMEEEAPNVMMLWNVFTIPETTIEAFYPGDDYVDYVGVNIYNVVYHNEKLEESAHHEDPLKLLDYVYNTYSDSKPIIIGEYGATNYTNTDDVFHTAHAMEKISRLYTYLPTLYPRVKMIYYFDVNTLINAPLDRRINNYALTENKEILNAYKALIVKPNYLTEIEQIEAKDEIFSYRDYFFTYQDTLYVDTRFLQEYLDFTTIKMSDSTQYTVAFQNESNIKPITVQSEQHEIEKSTFYEKRNIIGLPIVEILNHFAISYEKKDKNLHIYLNN